MEIIQICISSLIVMSLSLFLSAYSPEYFEDESSMSMLDAEEETDRGLETGQDEDANQSGRSAADAYVEALYAVLSDHVWPDGEEIADEYLENLTGNSFAIYDVDDDGTDELILRITASITMAGMRETVYRYDAATDTISEEFSGSPSMDFYDNGVILVEWSHNQGKGRKLWPFTLYVYNAGSDSYTCVGSADSWDEDLDPNGFPSEYDIDGDGTIYYLYGEDLSDSPRIADGAEYHEWLDPYLEDASLVELAWFSLDSTGIGAVSG